MQRQRQSDRALISLASANARLQRHHGSAAMANGREDEWKTATRRKSSTKHALVPCSKPGCNGSCPANVVSRGLQRDGVPAKCFECGRKYRLPPGGAKGAGGGNTGDKRLLEEVKRLKVELAAAKASTHEAESPAVEAANASANPEQELANAELSKAKETLRKLENTPEDMRGFFKQSFAEVVAEQKAHVQQLDARRRGLRPVNDQLKQSRTRLGHLQERHTKETKIAEATEEEIAKLQSKLAVQRAKAASTSEEIEKAKQEISQLNLAAAAEVTGDSEAKGVSNDAQCAASRITAAAVRSFFGSLPGTVAEHPEGQEAIKTVMQMLEKLDQAAKSEQSVSDPGTVQGGQASAAAHDHIGAPASLPETFMELDDELFTCMAEAAVPPATADDGEEAREIRKSKVAEAKARLRSDPGLATKVKKTVGKK